MNLKPQNARIILKKGKNNDKMIMNMSRVGVPRKVPEDGTLPPDEKPNKTGLRWAAAFAATSREALSAGVAVLPYLKWKEAENEKDCYSRIGIYGLAGEP
jgi:hypothetical protein